MKFFKLYWTAIAVAITAVVGLAGCVEGSDPAREVVSEIPPPQVKVAEVLHETITEWQEFTGRLEASATVELRPRVSGYISKVAFAEGSLVAAGKLLFEIDPRPFQWEVSRLQAELKSALARQKLANNDLQRAQRLGSQKAIAIDQLDARQAELEQAKALVASVQAQLETERLKLSFTKVVAPIDGHISNARVTAGNYVTVGETVLTSLVSTDEMYAYFNADEQTYLRYQMRQQALILPSQRVTMKLTNDTEFLHEGRIDFVDNQIDPHTGTIRFRAAFENSGKRLTPGLFVRLRVSGSPLQTILVDDKAIATDLANKYVLLLAADNTLEYRQVTPGDKYAGLRIIRAGLSEGDKIVTKGLQRVFPGSKVIAEEEPMLSPGLQEKIFAKLTRDNSTLAGKQTPLTADPNQSPNQKLTTTQTSP